MRPFNTFGSRQFARAVITTIISQLLAGKEEIGLGLLTPMTDFNYVKDAAAVYVCGGHRTDDRMDADTYGCV